MTKKRKQPTRQASREPSARFVGRRTFTDAAGRVWKVEVTTTTIRRCLDLLDVQLLDVVDPEAELCLRLGHDAVLLCDILYVVCMDEALARGISDEEFGRGLAGDALADASSALMRAVADFFPSQAQRDLRHTLLDRGQKLLDVVMSRVTQEVEAASVDAALDAFLARSSTPSAGGSPAS